MERQAGRAPMLTVENGHDPVRWAEQNREALRAAVDEHGAVLVRGLGLRDPAEVADAFQRLVPGGLMPDREAFAARQPYLDGVYSSLTWPANQPMCMHHELSYALEFPGLMLFACLQAPSVGGVTGVADASAVLDALPPDIVRGSKARGGCSPAATTRTSVPPTRRRSGSPTAPTSRATAGRTRSSSSGSPTGSCAPGNGAPPWFGTRRPANAVGSTRSRS